MANSELKVESKLLWEWQKRRIWETGKLTTEPDCLDVQRMKRGDVAKMTEVQASMVKGMV